ncbi:MAG TPA: PTS glucose transporter subunit IIA [Actinotalea sp.]|jgi:phosphotransferase system IIA component
MGGRPNRVTVQVTAPLAGLVVALVDVPDPLYAGGMLGIGLAILPAEPDPPGLVVAVAPCSGRLTSVYPHAVMVAPDAERAVLVHLGLETAGLDGDEFEVGVGPGQRVTEGQALISWSPEAVRAGGRSTLCPVVALQAAAADVLHVVAPGEQVEAGQVLLLWS